MKQRFRLYRRKAGGRFYVHDGLTGKQESLGTSDRMEAPNDDSQGDLAFRATFANRKSAVCRNPLTGQ